MKWFLLVNISVLSILTFTNVKALSSASEKESAGAFVQKFYDQYLILWSKSLKKHSKMSTHEVAIKQHPECFDRQLRKAVSDDENTQEKETNDIVGLNFDLFLGSQELWGKYQTGDVKQTGDRFLVDIHDIEKGKSKKEINNTPLRVVVELKRKNRQWIFTNFIYPSQRGKTNLLEILKDLKKERSKAVL